MSSDGYLEDAGEKGVNGVGWSSWSECASSSKMEESQSGSGSGISSWSDYVSGLIPLPLNISGNIPAGSDRCIRFSCL